MTGLILSAMVLMGVAVPAAAQSDPGDKALVERFVPQRIVDAETDESGQSGRPLSERYGFVAVDLNGTGSPDFLVAVYVTTDAGSGALRVLKKTDGSATVVQDFQLCRGGSEPRLSLLDLDHSAVPAILAELGGRAQLIDWVFKWNGNALAPFGPTESYHGAPCTVLQDADFIDLDGDGILEIVNEPEYLPNNEKSDAPRVYQVYKLVDGAYAPSGTFEYISGFVSPGPTSKPPRTEGFTASAPGSAYVMTIANGARDSEPAPTGGNWVPVWSAEIRLNGELVPGTEHLGPTTARYLKIPVTVKAHNTVDVKVGPSLSAIGAVRSMLTIAIGPAPPNSQSANSQK
jgi:hypothetical protein